MVCFTKQIAILMAFGLILLQGGLTSVALGKTEARIAEDRSLGEISQTRKLLRSACAKVKMSETRPEISEKGLQDAQTETEQAMVQWTVFYKSYESVPPVAYAAHPDWRASAKEIEKSMAKMAKAAKDRDAKNALIFCGQTCRKFVDMNEKAGIEMTTDVLFKFRKAAKPLLKTVQGKNFAEITPALQTLLALKKQAIALFNGAAVSADALTSFSESVDAFAETVNKADKNNIDMRYREMMAKMEAAYDRYL